MPITIEHIQAKLGLELKALQGVDVETAMRPVYQHHYLKNEAGTVLVLNLHSSAIKDEQLSFLKDMEGLQGLNLMHNELTQFHLSASLRDLQFLDLGENNSLKSLTFEGACPHLAWMDLNECALEKLAIPVGLDHLRKLDISRNKTLKSIEFKGDCPALRYLDLSENDLEGLRLPARFSALTYLYVNDNKRLHFVSFYHALPELKTLHLRHCNLDELPEAILGCEKLEAVYMYGNPWKNIPSQYIEEDERKSSWAHVKNYLSSTQRSDDNIPNDEVKMVLLGNSTVGKSSLIRYLDEGKYDPNHPSTHGIQNLTWKDEALFPFKVNVWDFGGQEFYHATHRFFLSDNAVTLLLFEPKTNVQGRLPTDIYLYKDNDEEPQLVNLEIEHFHYSYWLDTLAHYCGGNQIGKTTLLVQTKLGKADAELINIPDPIKNKYDFPPQPVFPVDVSLVDKGDPNARRSYETFKEKLIKLLDETRKTYQTNRKWQKIRDHIRKMGSKVPFWNLDTYRSECESILPGISKKDKQTGVSPLDTLSSSLFKTGVILHYPDSKNEKLKNTVFINPAWVTDTIYKVLNYDVVEKNQGRFNRARVEEVTRSLDFDLQADTLIGLMESFRLIFREKGTNDRFVAPQYLPAENPEADTKSFKRDLRLYKQHCFSLHFPTYLPRSVMTQFICEYGDLAEDGNLYWRDGIVLDQEEGKFLVERLSTKKQVIKVSATMENPDVASALYQSLLVLSERISDLQVSIDGVNFVHVHELEEAIQEEDPKIKSVQGKRVKTADFTFLYGQDNLPERLGLQHHARKSGASIRVPSESKGLQNELKLRIEKLNRIRQGLAIESDPSIKFKYEQQIKEEEEAIAGLKLKMSGGDKHPDPEPASTFMSAKAILQGVLYFSACPDQKDQLKFDTERREIDDAYERGNRVPEMRPAYEFQVIGHRFEEMLFGRNSDILHLSLHASKKKGLYFVDEANEALPMTPDMLNACLSNYLESHQLNCLLINACHSYQHAKALSDKIEYVIGMQDFIPDKAAIAYARGFYGTRFKGGSILQSHKAATNVLKLVAHKYPFSGQQFPLDEIPVLFINGIQI